MKTWLTHRMLVCVSARRSENDTGSKLSLQKAIARVLILWVLTAAAASAQTFTTLVDFDGSNGANPDPKALVQGADGNLYGTAQNGGTNNSGLQLNVPARKGGPLAQENRHDPPLEAFVTQLREARGRMEEAAP